MKTKVSLLKKTAQELTKRLRDCDICPRECHINRSSGRGFCKAAVDINVYTVFKHTGEEPGISGPGGSGTIFFSGCSLQCAYCQNYRFSHLLSGKDINIDQLSSIMLKLKKIGADNINLVTPTHYLPQIIEAIAQATEKGMDLPIVYNSSGFEKKDVIAMLDGIIDVYLTDIKYIDDNTAMRFSHANNYVENSLASTLEMYKQKPKIINDDRGIMTSGLIIRHLVLPGKIEESKKIISWINKNTPYALASIMFQYQPYDNANQIPELNRNLTRNEYEAIKEFCEESSINGFIQDFSPEEKLAGPYFQSNIEEFLAL